MESRELSLRGGEEGLGNRNIGRNVPKPGDISVC